MNKHTDNSILRKEDILKAAITVFGRYGFKKTSVDDIAEAANISKQGLYLHFSSKQEIFTAALSKYLNESLLLVQESLAKTDQSLFARLLEAVDVWFGRHLVTFSPESFDILETSKDSLKEEIERFKSLFKAKISKALTDSKEFSEAHNIGSPKEVAEVLFLCGLAWKDEHGSRPEFIKKMRTCIRVCCQIEK